MSKKKALILSYYYPPSGGSGVQRWMYFTKYMDELGIKPIVVTVNPDKASYQAIDESLSDKVSHVKTYRTNSFEPLRIYSRLKSGSASKALPAGDVPTHKTGLLDRVSNYIRSNFFVPDARVGWNKYAYRAAKKLIKEQNIKCVITTGPPHSTHLIGLKLKEKLNVNWVADFRDPWAELFYNDSFKKTNKTIRKDNALEKSVLEKSDKVITVGPSLAELLRSKIEDKKKVSYVYNGYDQDLMNKSKKIPQNETFTFVNIGLLSFKQDYKTLANSIEEAMRKVGFSARMIFAGKVDEEILKCFRSIDHLEVDFLGGVSHAKAIELMFKADILTNCLAEMKQSKILISGKMMEYLATENPILCIGNKEGDAANLLNKASNTIVCEKEDLNHAIDFIKSTYQNWLDPIQKEDNSFNIKEFSRFELTKELIKEIENYV